MEYNEFYRITFKKYLNPLASPHFTTEARWKKTSVGIVYNIHETIQAGYDLYLLKSGVTMLIY